MHNLTQDIALIQDIRLAKRIRRVWRPKHERRAGSPGGYVNEVYEVLEMLRDGVWVEVPTVFVAPNPEENKEP